MKDNVTRQTAERLKAAGFPQPKHAYPGMVLYSDEFTFETTIFCNEEPDYVYELNPSDIFAPTATDILREIPETKYSSLGIYWIHSKGVFHIYDAGELFFEHENPAEACAAAWLSIHEKEQDA